METKKTLRSIGYIITAVFAAIIALTALTFKSSAAISGDYTYALVNGEAKITKYSGTATELVIPSEIDGYKVTSVGASTFDGNKNLVSVTIPEGVTEIGKYAFRNCTNMTDIVLPENLLTIGDAAFYNCDKITSITIPSKVTSIGVEAFRDCNALTNLTMSDSVTTLGNAIFKFCGSLTDIKLSNNIEVIPNTAFYECVKLKNVNIPAKLTSIDASGFCHCYSLTELVLPDNVKSIGESAFSGCRNLKSMTLSKGLETIGISAFDGCGALETVVMHNGLSFIDKRAFLNCSKLKNITLPDTLTAIQDSAFNACTSLEKVNIPGGVKTLDVYAFFGCTNLTEVTFGNGVEKIYGNAFEGCSNITSIVLPSTLKGVYGYAFYNCSSLTTITIPKSLTTVGGNAFNGCNNLSEVYYEGTEEDWGKISIANKNENLKNANIHYSYLVSEFVDRLYTIILGRKAEAEGLADWTNRLASGTASSAEIVYGIANSQEFGNRGLSNDQIVDTMYQAMLGRPADEGGKANWINCLNSGMSVTGIINGFSGSVEFGIVCANYSIQPGAITTCDARDRNNGLTLFVSRMYTKALGRPYDVAGLNDWTNRYLTGAATVSDIAYGFIFSPEFVGKGLSNSDYVDTLYRTFFNREPDEGGKANWMNQLASGTAREDVLNGFVGSQECINLVATFGI